MFKNNRKSCTKHTITVTSLLHVSNTRKKSINFKRKKIDGRLYKLRVADVKYICIHLGF